MHISRLLFLILILSVLFLTAMAAPAKSSRRKKGKRPRKKKKLPPPLPTDPPPSRGPPEVLTDLIETPDAFEQLLEGVEFLQKFNFINTSTGFSADDLKVDEVSKGIKNMQKFAALEPTGVIDSGTIFVMRAPRCGEADVDPHEHKAGEVHVEGDEATAGGRKKRYIAAGGRYKWNKNAITWKLMNGPSNSRITKNQVKKEIRRAYDEWSRYTPLDFTYTDSDDADMRFMFGAKRHGTLRQDPMFDGKGGVLAHGFTPNSGWGSVNGDVHFDDDELFTYKERDGTNFFYTACHEIGHALGLDHSYAKTALMWPYDKGFIPNFRLPADDILGIQSIYGVRAGSPDPNAEPEVPVATPAPVFTDAKHGACTDHSIALIGGSLFVFQGAEFWRYVGHDVAQRLITPLHGYPIRKYFKGLVSNLDAAFTKYTGETVFLRGRNIWTYSQRTKMPGYPKRFAEVYPGVTKNIDAAYHDERNRITYFFQANLMWKFDERNHVLLHEAEGLYTSDEFDNLPYAPNAAFQDEDGHTYFLKGQKYYRYTRGSRELEYGYPKTFPFVDCH